jgi:large subunit ribosomal protein L11
MGKESVDALIEGGKASAAPPLGPALGPLKVNIGQVVAEINKKTAAFKGMKVPVKVIIDTETKEFEIEVGTPPASGLIRKELNLKKGSSYPNKEKVANMAIEDVMRVAQMKMDAFFAKDLKAAVKIIVGSANAMGILVEGKIAVDINPDIDAGKYDSIIKSEKTDVSSEKRAKLAEQLKEVQAIHAPFLQALAANKKAKAEKEEKKAAKVAKA